MCILLILFYILKMSFSLRLVHWNIQMLKSHDKRKPHHVDLICKKLINLNPNIASLCEVSDEDELMYIKNKINPSFYQYFTKGHDLTRQNIGLITSVKPTVLPYVLDTSVIPKHSICGFNINGIDMQLISVHFLANPQNKARSSVRELQARTLSSVIEKLSLHSEIIVAGDLNDFDPDVLDCNKNLPISNVLRIVKGNNMLNTNLKLTSEQRYTYIYKQNKVMIDHILMTPKLFSMVKKVNVYRSGIKSINDSDHDPIVIDF